jgi:surfeit locus 1 family protein
VALRKLVWAVAAGFACAGFVALGNWQVHRRAWKLDLIARVDQRISAAPVAAPTRAQWTHISAAADAYRHVCANGVFLSDRETVVRAVSRLGAGFWVMTPLRTAGGEYLLINRGFVGPEQPRAPLRVTATQVCGLLRLSEPHGGFLHRNDPLHDAWYSRDVAAIAAARGLPAQEVAPYFVDADASPNPGGWPVGGLTVTHFDNNHLVYALTWYCLALLAMSGVVLILRGEPRAGG